MTVIERRPLRPVKMPAKLHSRPQRQSPEPTSNEPKPAKPVSYDKLTGRYRVNLQIGSTSVPLGDFSKHDEAAWSYRQARRALNDLWTHAMEAARREAKRERRKKQRV
jgi:hypothetical protein